MVGDFHRDFPGFSPTWAFCWHKATQDFRSTDRVRCKVANEREYLLLRLAKKRRYLTCVGHANASRRLPRTPLAIAQEYKTLGPSVQFRRNYQGAENDRERRSAIGEGYCDTDSTVREFSDWKG